MNMNDIYDGWDMSDDGSPIQTACRVRDVNGKTALIAAISTGPIKVALDSDLRGYDCWYEIEWLEKPPPRFSREHAIIVCNQTGVAMLDGQAGRQVTVANLASMQLQMFLRSPNPFSRLIARIVDKDINCELMRLHWPPILANEMPHNVHLN